MPEYRTQNQYSTSVGLVYIFNLIVGTGALTLPAVFARSGWLLGIFVITILALISFITATFVIEAMASANAITHWNKIQDQKRNSADHEPSNSDSEDTPLVSQLLQNRRRSGRGSPDFASSRYYVIDEKMEMGEMATIFFDKLDVACTHQPVNISCNETIPDSAVCWEGLYYNRMDAYRMFLTAFITILGPFVFFNVQKTKYLQLITSGMRWIAFSFMILYALRILIVSGPRNSPPAVALVGIPGLFGVCVYSFMCHHSLPALVAPITNKMNINRSLSFDYILIALFYLLLALTGTFAFQHLDDLYTLDFSPRGNGFCSKTDNTLLLISEYYLAVFPVFTLSTSFPVIAITLKNNLQSLFLGSDNSTYNYFIREILFPILAIFPPYAIAMTTKNLKVLVGLTGSFAGVGIQYLLPTFLVYYARKKTNSVIGLGVRNKFMSPFAGQHWLSFVVIWACACMILVSFHLYEQWIYSKYT
ncbi:transmembrane protein 104 homolog isoform X2 [Aphidius gifuensis]|uniref:transmembrane protein 104 homolog isoform X2 n=1 Tax=Aphidius gifuensis TaxID=684658 RepID=UPI001CDBFD85|nr:transmembrane protein 104 homolog isoform X2 [Aphidius gifuensis]